MSASLAASTSSGSLVAIIGIAATAVGTLGGVWLTQAFYARAEARRLEHEKRSLLHADRLATYRHLRVLFAAVENAGEAAGRARDTARTAVFGAWRVRESEREEFKKTIDDAIREAESTKRELWDAEHALETLLLELDVLSTQPVREAASALYDKLSMAYQAYDLGLPYSGPVDTWPGNWLWESGPGKEPRLAEVGDIDKEALEEAGKRFEGLDDRWQKLVVALREELGVGSETDGPAWYRGSRVIQFP